MLKIGASQECFTVTFYQDHKTENSCPSCFKFGERLSNVFDDTPLINDVLR